jgi:hypothetical protein
MANYKIAFIGSNKSETNETELECFLNKHGEITIRIDDGNDVPNIISLDKSTSIKFAKTLRTEINKIEEVQDGE